MRTEVPLNLIPDEYKAMLGRDVPFDLVPDELRAMKGAEVPLNMLPVGIQRVQIPQATTQLQKRTEEEGLPAMIGKSIMGGFGAIGTGLAGVVKAGLETVGIEDPGIAEMEQIVTDYWAPKVGESTAKKYVSAIIRSTAQSVPTMLTGPLALPLFGLTSAGNKYIQLRDAGQRIKTSLAASIPVGISEAITEKLPLGVLMKQGTPIVKRLLKATALEIPGEQINTIVELVVDKFTIRPGLTLKEYLDDVIDTAVVTIGQTLLTGGLVHGLVKGEKVVKPREVAKPEPAPKIAEPELAKPIIKGQEVPLEMIPTELVKTRPVGEYDWSLSGDQAREGFVKRALSEGKPVPPEVLKDYPELAKEAKVEGVPEKTISQFTQEYREGLGEGGFINVGGVEKTKPKVVVPGTKDVSLLEFPLTTLHVADRHPELAPIIKGNIKAEQNTNHWILRKSDRISEAFDKVEKPGVWMNVFGRKGTDIRDLDLMIEGKKPTPTELTEFVTETKGILGEIKGEVIQKMKNDFAESLSPKQKEYLDWVEGGRIGEEPKVTVARHTYTNKQGKVIIVPEYTRPVPKATKMAVDEAQTQFKEMEGWGIQDYFPHIFKGRYKYLTEDGHIIASGQTAKQSKANFEEYVESHPEAVDKTFMFVNDFYDLMTVRKTLNPELTSPLEYLGTRLSRKEFFRLLGRTEEVIKQEIANAGVDDIPKVKVDMSGIASFQKGTKFSGHFLKRKTSLRGEEVDPFRALTSYVFSVGRKLGLEDAKMASYAFADSIKTKLPNAANYIKMQADLMSGRYNIVDKIFDETIGEKLGMKPFGVTRMVAKGVGLESKLKLGYAPAKTAINYMGSVFHTVLKEGVTSFIEGGKLINAKDPYLMSKIASEGHLAGMEQLFAGEGLIGVSQKKTALWRPLGSYQWVEVKGRTRALAAGYVSGLKKFNGDKDAAWIYALDSAQLTQFLYNTAAKPVLVRGPVAQASYQFKQYLNSEIRFMSTLTPTQWAGYIAGITAVAGTKGALLTIKSILAIATLGLASLGIDELMERLNRKAPRLHRGIFGLIGIDVSAPASWQIPVSVRDWIGTFPNDLIATGEMIVKRLKNNGWTDEDINDYWRQILPVAYNVFKGLQILSEGVTKEGTKVIYRGGKEEGVINLTGARSVSQSQASDSARYMNQQRRLFLEKSKVLEDKLFGSKSAEEANDIFKELVELKNIQTPKEMEDLINGLRQSAKSRQMTEEIRIFLTLPRALKKEEIKRR